jgi:hypothetical protein
VRPPAATVAALGPEPTVHTERQSWINAVETRAIHNERFGDEDHPDRLWSEQVVEATIATAQAAAGRVLVDAELGF